MPPQTRTLVQRAQRLASTIWPSRRWLLREARRRDAGLQADQKLWSLSELQYGSKYLGTSVPHIQYALPSWGFLVGRRGGVFLFLPEPSRGQGFTAG